MLSRKRWDTHLGVHISACSVKISLNFQGFSLFEQEMLSPNLFHRTDLAIAHRLYGTINGVRSNAQYIDRHDAIFEIDAAVALHAELKGRVVFAVFALVREGKAVLF